MDYISEQLHELFYNPHKRGFYTVNYVLLGITLVAIAGFIMETVPALSTHQSWFDAVERATVAVFTFEYVCRIVARRKDLASYLFSFFGIIDFLSIAPTYLGFPAFTYLKTARVLRVLRFMRLIHVSKLARITDPEEPTGPEDEAHLYTLIIRIYFVSLLCCITIFGTLIYIAEGWRPEFGSIPLGMIWAAKVIMGGVAQHMPETMWGDLVTIATRFSGLALFGLLISIIGTHLKRMLFGSISTTG